MLSLEDDEEVAELRELARLQAAVDEAGREIGPGQGSGHDETAAKLERVETHGQQPCGLGPRFAARRPSECEHGCRPEDAGTVVGCLGTGLVRVPSGPRGREGCRAPGSQSVLVERLVRLLCVGEIERSVSAGPSGRRQSCSQFRSV